MRGVGRYSDGKTARVVPVVIHLAQQGVVIADEDGAKRAAWRYAHLHLTDPWRPGNGAARFRHGADEARLSVQDERLIKAILAHAPHLHGGRDRDARPGLVAGLVAGLALTLVAGWYLVDQGAPALVKALISAEDLQGLGDRTAALIVGEGEGAYCPVPPALDALAERLAQAADGGETAYDLRIANIDMVNAFAMPGGRIVLMRGLVEGAENAEEIAGVIAHEMGHVIERHPIEGFARAMGAQLLLTILAPGGDTALGLGGDALLLSYGRDAEREADDWAARILAAAAIDARPLGAFFDRLGDGGDGDDDDSLAVFLSTHPAPVARARLFTTPGGEAMDAAGWTALRTACADAPAPRRPFERFRFDERAEGDGEIEDKPKKGAGEAVGEK